MPLFMNLSILKKLIGAFALVIATIVGTSTVVWQKVAFIQESNVWTVHTYEVLETLNRVMAAMVDQETGLRGYLVAGDERFLEPYHKGREAYAAALAHVRGLTADNAAQQIRLGELDQFAKTWMGRIAEAEIALMRQPERWEEARAMEAGGAGKASLDGIRRKVAEADKVERDLLAARRATQDEAFRASRALVLAGGAGSLLLAVIACCLLAVGIARPIAAMTGAMGRLARGDTATDVPARGRADEIGEMADAVEVFKRNMIEADRLAAERAAGNEARLARAGKVEELTRGFEAGVGQVVGSVASAATELQATAREMGATAEETTRQSTAVAAASEQASVNVETAAAATEELSSSIREIGHQVTRSTAMIAEAVEQANLSNERVRGLTATAERIGDVVRIISDIAGQTNLLRSTRRSRRRAPGRRGRGSRWWPPRSRRSPTRRPGRPRRSAPR